MEFAKPKNGLPAFFTPKGEALAEIQEFTRGVRAHVNHPAPGGPPPTEAHKAAFREDVRLRKERAMKRPSDAANYQHLFKRGI